MERCSKVAGAPMARSASTSTAVSLGATRLLPHARRRLACRKAAMNIMERSVSGLLATLLQIATLRKEIASVHTNPKDAGVPMARSASTSTVVSLGATRLLLHARRRMACRKAALNIIERSVSGLLATILPIATNRKESVNTHIADNPVTPFQLSGLTVTR